MIRRLWRCFEAWADGRPVREPLRHAMPTYPTEES